MVLKTMTCGTRRMATRLRHVTVIESLCAMIGPGRAVRRRVAGWSAMVT
jgi:hypothetical protein